MEIIWDASRLRLYLLWLAADGLSVHSCDAWAKNGASIGDVFGFDGEIFDGFISHHFQELASVGWPVMAWAMRAAMASWTSCLVKPS